jgi:hypothetical protein
MKKYFLGIVALILAVCFSAFTYAPPKTDGLVYFKIVGGSFDDLDGGIQDETPFDCTGDDEVCAKGYDPARTTVVTPNGPTTWTLLQTGASTDDVKERDIIE